MYEAHFNLKSQPFRLNPDARFFYASKKHDKALSYLEFGLNQGEGFLVVTGDPGTGKTLLLQVLEKELGSQYLISRVNTSTKLTAIELLKLIAIGFGMQQIADDKITLLNQLNGFFNKNLNTYRHGLILIDESHHLSAEVLEELRLLTNFQRRGIYKLQCFLVGQSSLRETLADPALHQLSQRIVAACHLHPLDKVETQAYIQTRLAYAGYPHRVLFSNASVSVIHKFTQGIPRRINRVCDRALLWAAVNEQVEISEDCVCEVIEELSGEMESEFASATNRSLEFDFSDPNPVSPIKNVIALNDFGAKHKNLTGYQQPLPGVNISLALGNLATEPAMYGDIGIVGHRSVVIDAADNGDSKSQMNIQDQERLTSWFNKSQTEIVSKKQKKERIGDKFTKRGLTVILNLVQKLFPDYRYHFNQKTQTAMALKGGGTLVALAMILIVFQDSLLDNNVLTTPPYAAKNAVTENTVSKVTLTNKTPVESPLFESHLDHLKIFPESLAPSLQRAEVAEEPADSNSKYSAAPQSSREMAVTLKQAPLLQTKTEIPEASFSTLGDQQVAILQTAHKELSLTEMNDDKHLIDIEKISRVSLLIAPVNPQERVAIEEAQVAPPQLLINSQMTNIQAEAVNRAEDVHEKNATSSLNVILDSDVDSLIDKYTSAYKDANLDKISDVLNKNIKTDNLSSKTLLIAEYAKLFNITEKRNINFSNIVWDKKNERAVGKGRFSVSIIEKGRFSEKNFNGAFTLHMEKNDSEVSITEIYYVYDN